jgi:hypothetical protein
MNKIKKKYRQFLLIIYVRLLKCRANKLYKRTGVQQFIVKWNDKLTIINKEQFKLSRQNGLFPKHFTADNLKKISLYYTKKL